MIDKTIIETVITNWHKANNYFNKNKKLAADTLKYYLARYDLDIYINDKIYGILNPFSYEINAVYGNNNNIVVRYVWNRHDDFHIINHCNIFKNEMSFDIKDILFSMAMYETCQTFLVYNVMNFRYPTCIERIDYCDKYNKFVLMRCVDICPNFIKEWYTLRFPYFRSFNGNLLIDKAMKMYGIKVKDKNEILDTMANFASLRKEYKKRMKVTISGTNDKCKKLEYSNNSIYGAMSRPSTTCPEMENKIQDGICCALNHISRNVRKVMFIMNDNDLVSATKVFYCNIINICDVEFSCDTVCLSFYIGESNRLLIEYLYEDIIDSILTFIHCHYPKMDNKMIVNMINNEIFDTIEFDSIDPKNLDVFVIYPSKFKSDEILPYYGIQEESNTKKEKLYAVTKYGIQIINCFKNHYMNIYEVFTDNHPIPIRQKIRNFLSTKNGIDNIIGVLYDIDHNSFYYDNAHINICISNTWKCDSLDDLKVNVADIVDTNGEVHSISLEDLLFSFAIYYIADEGKNDGDLSSIIIASHDVFIKFFNIFGIPINNDTLPAVCYSMYLEAEKKLGLNNDKYIKYILGSKEFKYALLNNESSFTLELPLEEMSLWSQAINEIYVLDKYMIAGIRLGSGTQLVRIFLNNNER